MPQDAYLMTRGFLGAIGVSLGVIAGASAMAADLPTKKPAAPAVEPAPVVPSRWQVNITLYGWIGSLAGNAGARQFPTAPFHAGFGALLEHVQGAFSGAAVVRNDTFIAGLDVIWADLGTSLNFPATSALSGAGGNLRLDTALISAFGGLRIPLGSPNLALYGTVGARYFYDQVAISLASPAVGFANTTVSRSWVDPIVGLSAHYSINDKWFVNGEADVGGLHDSATAQVLGAVGYNWSQTIATTVGYRMAYGYDRQAAATGSFRLQEWIYGPFVALKFNF